MSLKLCNFRSWELSYCIFSHCDGLTFKWGIWPEHKTDPENNWAAELGLNLSPLCCPEIDITLTNPLPPGAVGLFLPPGSLLWSGRWCHCHRRHSLPLLWWCQRLRRQICCWGLKLKGARTTIELLDHSLFSSEQYTKTYCMYSWEKHCLKFIFATKPVQKLT